jgi:hypothetical protein
MIYFSVINQLEIEIFFLNIVFPYENIGTIRLKT